MHYKTVCFIVFFLSVVWCPQHTAVRSVRGWTPKMAASVHTVAVLTLRQRHVSGHAFGRPTETTKSWCVSYILLITVCGLFFTSVFCIVMVCTGVRVPSYWQHCFFCQVSSMTGHWLGLHCKNIRISTDILCTGSIYVCICKSTE